MCKLPSAREKHIARREATRRKLVTSFDVVMATKLISYASDSIY